MADSLQRRSKRNENRIIERYINKDKSSTRSGFRGLYFGDQYWDIQQIDFFTAIVDDIQYIPSLVTQTREDVLLAADIIDKQRKTRLKNIRDLLSKERGHNPNYNPSTRIITVSTLIDPRGKQSTVSKKMDSNTDGDNDMHCTDNNMHQMVDNVDRMKDDTPKQKVTVVNRHAINHPAPTPVKTGMHKPSNHLILQQNYMSTHSQPMNPVSAGPIHQRNSYPNTFPPYMDETRVDHLRNTIPGNIHTNNTLMHTSTGMAPHINNMYTYHTQPVTYYHPILPNTPNWIDPRVLSESTRPVPSLYPAPALPPISTVLSGPITAPNTNPIPSPYQNPSTYNDKYNGECTANIVHGLLSTSDTRTSSVNKDNQPNPPEMKEKQKHSVTPNVLPKSTPAEDNSLKESNTSSEGKEDKGYSGQEFIELYMSDNEVDKTPNVIPKTTPPDNIAQLIHKRKSANVRKPVRANNTAKSTGLKKSKKMLTTKPSNEKLSNKGVNDRNIFRAFVDSELAEITTKSATPSKEPKDIPRNSSKSYGVASFSDADLNLEGPMTLPSSSQQLIECSIYKSKPSRVGVIPSAGIKLSESYLNIPQPVTVLMRPEKRDYDLREERKRQKREHKRQKTTSHLKDISVFSGPRFSPGVYVIQATADDRRKNYVPDTGDIIDKESELNNVIARPSQYVKPDVSEYFKAALSDASRLPKYDEYNSRDPINFRHAYKAKSKSSHEPKVITKTAATILAADHEHTPPRRRHRKMIRDKSPEVVSDHESRKYNAMEIRNELLKDISDDDVEEVFDVDEDDKEEDVVFVQDSISELEHNDGHGHEYEDEDDRNTEHEQDDYMHDDQEDSIMIDDHHMSNQGLATTNLNLTLTDKFSKRTIPSRSVGISRLKKLGSFLERWKLNDPEMCCVCHVTGASMVNQLIYCDNPSCEVIVHRKCYSMKALPPKSKRWYCDRCRNILNTPQLQVTCAFCPHTYGGFVKLRKPFFNIFYAHLFCLKLITHNRYQYDMIAQEYKVSFSRMNLALYNSVCMFCDDPKYANYGAKLTCLRCPKAFHVSCGARRGLCDIGSNNIPIAFCPEHCRTSNQLSHLNPGEVSAYDKWVDQRTRYLAETFYKSPGVFALEAWKQSLGQGKFLPHTYHIAKFDEFRDAILETPAKFLDSDYNDWTNGLLRLVRTLYIPAVLDGNHLYSVTDEAIEIAYDSADYPEYIGIVNLEEEDKESYLDREETRPILKEKNRKRGRPSKNPEEKVPKVKRRRRRTLLGQRKSFKAKATGTKKLKEGPYTESGNKDAVFDMHDLDGMDDDEALTVYKKQTRKSRKKMEVARKDPSTLICAECGTNELPVHVLERLQLTDEYILNLEKTSQRRQNGYTGVSDWWDPRVFVECSRCETDVHCGCPIPPIKGYPRRYETFLCIQCDEQEETAVSTSIGKEARRKRINYKE